ncbi:hypothetical protein B566_EDAN015315, partial [Ephemera danica]
MQSQSVAKMIWEMTWTGSSHTSSQTASVIYIACLVLLNRSQVLGFAYNEAMPVESSNATKAHAKGFVLVDVQSETGIWMPHTVPKFDLGTEYAYPETGTKYGQHFACFSLDQTALKELGEHLSSMNVQSVQSIQSLNWDDYSLSYPSGRDHSNWGVSDVGNTVCVGDLDRKSTHTK